VHAQSRARIPAPGRRLDRSQLCAAVAVWFLSLSLDAFGQFSGSATVVSDYRFRGVSLSHNRPAAQVAVAYDDASGWYGGAFASTVQLVYPTNRELQLVSFLGYARRMPSGLSWEAGADYSLITGAQSYSYSEAYVGLSSENVNARLYYAPRYFGQDTDVIYGEINAAQRLLDRVRLLAHAGALHNNSDGAYNQRPDHRIFDVSVGVAFDLDRFNVQLSWVGVSSVNTPYPVAGMRSKNGAVLLLSYSF
jgi:uncharacterized protein (TIGR02001 family)